MPPLPAELLPFIVEFQSLFSKPVWQNAQTLLVGAILALGQRTVTACLRVTGLSEDQHCQNYHRVLNRAQWSALAARVRSRSIATQDEAYAHSYSLSVCALCWKSSRHKLFSPPKSHTRRRRYGRGSCVVGAMEVTFAESRALGH